MTLNNITLKEIQPFLGNHHILSLATCGDNQPYCCNVFYVYDSEKNHFIFASSDDTKHIENIKINKNTAGTIHLDTDVVTKIQGVQFKGKTELYKGDKMIYFKRFPLSVVLKPKLWCIHVEWLKITDNRLGFGKKLIWQRP